MHKLIIEDDEGKAVVVPLIREEISIGRQEGNTIRLTERNVSRRHARLVRREGRYVLEDLGSHTGTKVNGAAIKAAVPLSDGDHILIGDYKLAIKIERPTTTTLGYPNMPLATGGPTPATPVASPAIQPASHPTTPSAPLTAMAPAEPMEGAPTIPVRTLVDQGLAPGAAPVDSSAASTAAPARLVVTTPPLAGQEFLLDRASVVIGRTQENDIVLNHKSISRHHAKVIRDGDRYVVVDLESANGVRVNGAEYERVELQSGDMLELGHVRLRFVTADDAGTYDSDLRFGRNRKPLFIGLGAAVVLVAGGLLIFGGKKETAKLPPPLPAKVAVTPLPATPPPPAVPTPPPATPPGESVASLLAEAKKAYEQQKWGDAIALVDKAAKASPTDTEDITELRKAVEAEQQNAAKFEALRHSSDIKDYEAVLRGGSDISEGSFYKSKARALEDEARGKLIARHLDTAEKRRSDGNCADARKEANAVLAIDAENQAAQDLIARCGKPAKPAALAVKPAPTEAAPAEAPTPPPRRPVRTVAAATPPSATPAAVTPPPTAGAPKAVASATPPTPKPPRAAGGARAPGARAPGEGPGPSAADGDALMQEAQDAWLKGQYSAAIDASRKALRAKPGLTRAYQIIAVCSCSLRDAESATKAYERLDDRNKQLVKQLCAKSGITIE
jgi:pSer/pThr/pTyr-binding forkhead associated (FHA) protein/tetratricopeptide (TPR) repeat protein